MEKIAKNLFSIARIDHVARRSWNWQRGLQHVHHYSNREEEAVLGTDTSSKYLCLSGGEGVEKAYGLCHCGEG